MHRSTQPPELIDAWLPPRVGRNARLERLTDLIDWAPLQALVADLHAAPVGRPSYPPLLMVKVLLLQQWYQASDPAMEEALWERLSFRRFVGLGLQDAAPDHSTISRFRTQLTTAGLAEPLFAAVEEQLAARGVLVQQGTLVDATLVAAQVRPTQRWGHWRGQPPGPGRGLGPARPAGPLWLQAAPGRGCRLGAGPPGGADPGQRERDPGGGQADCGRRSGRVRGCGLRHARAQRPAAEAGDPGSADAAAHQTSPPAEPGGAPPPRPDRTGAAAGGACVRDVETLVRLPAGALPRAGPQYHRDVVQAAGLQPAARGPVVGRRRPATLGVLRPRPGKTAGGQASAGDIWRSPAPRRSVAGQRPPRDAAESHYSKVSQERVKS